MKIVRPWVKIVNDTSNFVTGDIFGFDRENGIKALQKIEYMSRISHRSEEAMTENSWDRFIRFVVMQKGDFSVIEHANLTVLMYHDRGIQQELTRHRLASYTIESTRFVNYEKKMPPSFIYPKVGAECEHCLAGNQPVRIKEIFGGEGIWVHDLGDRLMRPFCYYDGSWLDAIDTSEIKYKSLLKKGWAPQEARSVLPLGLGSLIADTANLRQWRHEMLIRTTTETHPQFRQVTLPLLEEFKRTIPILFDDIEPLGKQSENLKKMR